MGMNLSLERKRRQAESDYWTNRILYATPDTIKQVLAEYLAYLDTLYPRKKTYCYTIKTIIR